jgi:hypothetical protein
MNTTHPYPQPLTFLDVAVVNLERCNVWHPQGITEWTVLEWAGAMCGEAGEAANVAKKIRRVDCGIKGSDKTDRRELIMKLKKEIGDTYLYLDLLAQNAGLSMGECVTYAFNTTSVKEGLPQRIP